MFTDIIRRKIAGGISVIILTLAVLICFSSKNAVIDVFKRSDDINLPVLMYHSVIRDPSRSGKYVITPEKFEEDLLYLIQKGYTTVSAKQLVQYVYNSSPLPKKPVVITFDDGMYNNYKYILPILQKYNSCAIFSVVGSYTDEYSLSNIVNPSYSYLRWCDINEIAETGLVEFGNHSYAFHTISSARYGTQKNKYENSLDYISTFYSDTQKMQSEFYSNCNFRPIIYTYPFGSYSKESARVLKKTGFLLSFSCIEGINTISHNKDCLFMLKRYNRDGRISTYEFFSKLKL